jgi:hypothetical protein
MMGDWVLIVLVVGIVVLVVCPPRYDPAIRLKEWNKRL